MKKKLDVLRLINPTPKQKKALSLIDNYKYVLYGGAMGGGKSYLLRWGLVYILSYYWTEYGIKNITVGLFCEDYPSLRDRHESKIRFEFPAWLGTLNQQNHEFRLDADYGGGIIAMRNLDDPSKYASAEFAAIAVDELTKDAEETFDFIRTRLRWPGIPDPKFIAGTNPGSRGHGWVKKKFIDKEFDPNEQEANQFAYLPAMAIDNPHIDDSYAQILDSLPEKMRKAFRDGDWDIFVGQYFTEWRKEQNTCEPFTIPEYWHRFLSIDYGHAHPSAVYWGALDPVGRVYIYRELYGEGYNYSALGKKIMEMTPKEERDKLETNVVADPAIFSKKGENTEGKSGDQMMNDATRGWLNLRRANNERVLGWGVMREYLKPFTFENRVTSKLIFFNTCREAIRTIPSLVHSETVPEDVEKKSEDDAGDSIRYMLMDIFETFSKKEKERPTQVKTVQERFDNDMYWEKKHQEERELQEETSWMDI